MDIANDETFITSQHEGKMGVPSPSFGELHSSGNSEQNKETANDETLITP